MVKARQYVLKRRFVGVPKRDDYEIIESELPNIQNGEILVKSEWVSVDPFQRAYDLRHPLPYHQYGFQVGIVVDSKNPRYPAGSRIVTDRGWCDYYILNIEQVEPGVPDFKSYDLPDLKGLSPSLGVGAAGMPGVSAYFGFLEICKPKKGETVVVTAAAGAVGSLVGQIAKIKGCKVIGFAGSNAKVEFLEKELGFDKAFNYKTVDVNKALKEAAPEGVDCYFDNVGGEISSIIMSNMNIFGRVSVSGSISSYNELRIDAPKTPILQPTILFKQLTLKGFIVTRWMDRWPEAIAQLVKWISSGQLRAVEHVTEGFDNIYDAFVGMLAGENTGKAIVKM